MAAQKISLVPSAGPFPKRGVSRGVIGEGGRSEDSHNRRQTMAKNGPGVALNRPQDTERYNAKDSIVKRAVKCSCLVSKRSGLRSVSAPFHPACSPPLITSSPPRQFKEGGGRRSSAELRKLRNAFFREQNAGIE